MRLTISPGRAPRLSAADWLIAAAAAMLAQAEVWSNPDQEPTAAFAAAALATTVPLLFRRIAPIAVLVAIFVPLFGLKVAGDPLDAAFVMLALLIAFAAVGAYCERRRALVGLVLGLLLLVALVALEYVVPTADGEPPAPADLTFVGGMVTVVWLLAVLVRQRSQEAERHADRAERLDREREERARAAVAEERARIARELHDVVAHSISVIAVQTGSTRRRLREARPREAGELVGVEETARQALADMRRMLGLLRAEEDGPGLAPQPGIDQVDALVEHVRAAGLDVELVVDGDPRTLPAGLDLAAYRIVQEALTNVIKHAGAARAQVRVGYGERQLELEIEDDGDGAPAESGDGGGHGLVGMRERVALYGGSLDAGRRSDGGFAVRAVLPVSDR